MEKFSSSFLHKAINFILSFYLLVALISCKQATTEFQLVSNKNCHPPCWLNIIPGKTTKQEVITLLNKNSIVESKSIVATGKPWNSFNDIVLFTTLSNNLNGEIYFVNDMVVYIGLFGDINISYSKAIEELGEPEYIINIPMHVSNNSYEIFALIPKKGIDFAYNTIDKGVKSKIEIIPENKITRVDFFDPNFYDYLLEAGTFSEGFLNAAQTKKYMIPWSGYGEIDQKYPPAILEFR